MGNRHEGVNQSLEREQERRAVKRSVKAVPERVALWFSIIDESNISEKMKKELKDLFTGHVLAITPKDESYARPGAFRTVNEYLSGAEDLLWRICAENMANDGDKENLPAVYQNIKSDIEALKVELYAE